MAIMDDVSVQWPECTPKFDSKYMYGYTGVEYSFGDCGNSSARYYFVAFKLICESILLNLFIGYAFKFRVLLSLDLIVFVHRHPDS